MHDILNGLLDYVILGLTRGSMYALIALGYTLVYGVLQLINFAHSEVFMSGAFGSYLIISMFVDDGATPPWYGVAALVLLGLLSGGTGRSSASPIARCANAAHRNWRS